MAPRIAGAPPRDTGNRVSCDRKKRPEPQTRRQAAVAVQAGKRPRRLDTQGRAVGRLAAHAGARGTRRDGGTNAGRSKDRSSGTAPWPSVEGNTVGGWRIAARVRQISPTWLGKVFQCDALRRTAHDGGRQSRMKRGWRTGRVGRSAWTDAHQRPIAAAHRTLQRHAIWVEASSWHTASCAVTEGSVRIAPISAALPARCSHSRERAARQGVPFVAVILGVS